MRLLHSVVRQEFLPAADGVEVMDLGVNPLSMLLIALRPLNDTGTLANFQSVMGISQALNAVRVLHRGAAIVSARGEDLLAFNYHRHGMIPYEANPDDVDNERRCVVLPILLGRFAYDPHSCFPATTRGELTLELDVDIADTGYDGLRISVEQVEIIGASPKEFERKTSINRTFAATGFQDYDLPNGNLVRGALLFGTTGYDGATPAPSWGRIELLKDNEQFGYASTDWEVLKQLGQVMGRQPPVSVSHFHEFEPVAGVRTLGPPREVGDGVSPGLQNYAYLDLDPTRDDTFSVDTRGSSNFLLRANVETADAARVVLVERVAV